MSRHVCPYCNKKYKQKKSFDKHIKKCKFRSVHVEREEEGIKELHYSIFISAFKSTEAESAVISIALVSIAPDSSDI